MFAFILLALYCTVHAATKTCAKTATNYYSQRCCPVRDKSVFFDAVTSPLKVPQQDRCKPITNQAFRKLFPWITSAQQVEHIVDKANGPEHLEECNKDIMGNLIIAAGEWNQQVGQMCWKDVEREKRSVYGSDIMSYALTSAEECCGKAPSKAKYGVAVLAVVIPVIVFTLHLLLHSNCEKYKEKYDTVIEMVTRRDDQL